MKISNEKVEESLLTSRALAPVENETQRVLRRALDLLGPNGELWNHGPAVYEGLDSGPGGCKCIGWALGLAQGATGWMFSWETPANRAMDAACEEAGYDGYTYFNEEAPTFSEVRQAFKRAITLASTHP